MAVMLSLIHIFAVIGDMNVTRLIVTDASGRALYDSVPGQNAEGKLLFDWTWFKIETIRIRVDNVEMKKEELENDTFI